MAEVLKGLDSLLNDDDCPDLTLGLAHNEASRRTFKSIERKHNSDIEESPYFFRIEEDDIHAHIDGLRECIRSSLDSKMFSSKNLVFNDWRHCPILFWPMADGIKNRYIFTVFYYEYGENSIEVYTHDVYVKPTAEGFYVFVDEDDDELLSDEVEEEYENDNEDEREVHDKRKTKKSSRFYKTLPDLCDGEIKILEKSLNNVSWKTLRDTFSFFADDGRSVKAMRKSITPSDFFLSGLSARDRALASGDFNKKCIMAALKLDPKTRYETYQLVLDHFLGGRNLDELAKTAWYREATAGILGCNESAVCTVLKVLGFPYIIDIKPAAIAAVQVDQSVLRPVVHDFTRQREMEKSLTEVDDKKKLAFKTNYTRTGLESRGAGAGLEEALERVAEDEEPETGSKDNLKVGLSTKVDARKGKL